MLRVANSTPIVDFDSKLNSFLVNLASKLLFPTPESPINTTAIKKYLFSMQITHHEYDDSFWVTNKVIRCC